MKIVNEVFEVTNQEWRGIGIIADSGLRLRQEYSEFNAEIYFNLQAAIKSGVCVCIAGKILQGVCKPIDVWHLGKCLFRNIRLEPQWSLWKEPVLHITVINNYSMRSSCPLPVNKYDI